jgi:hypothetical protein
MSAHQYVSGTSCSAAGVRRDSASRYDMRMALGSAAAGGEQPNLNLLPVVTAVRGRFRLSSQLLLPTSHRPWIA